jgi:hypothetical protein
MNEKLQIEYVKISELHLSDYNPKKYDQKASKNLECSIKTYGWLMPVLVNKRTGNIIDGNQKIKTEIKKGASMESLVPVIYFDVDLDTEKKMNRALGESTHTQEDPMMAVDLLKSIENQDEFIKSILEDYEKQVRLARKKFEPEMNILVDADEMYDYIFFLADKGINFLTASDFFALTNVYEINREKMLGLGRAVKMDKLIKLIDFARKHGVNNINEIQ